MNIIFKVRFIDCVCSFVSVDLVQCVLIMMIMINISVSPVCVSNDIQQVWLLLKAGWRCVTVRQPDSQGMTANLLSLEFTGSI